MSNPVDEYLEAPIVKEAIFGGAKQLMLPGMRQWAGSRMGGKAVEGAMSGLATAGVMGLVGAAGKAYQALTKKKDFDAMLEVNPDLREHQRNDPSMFNQRYNSLRAMSPRFASDPVVAGGLMRHMSEMPGAAHSLLMQTARDTPKEPFAELRAGPVTVKGIPTGY